MAAVLALGGTSYASADLIDFEDTNAGLIVPNVTSEGYFFSPAVGEPFNGLVVLFDGQLCGPVCAANGTQALAVGGVNSNPTTVHPVTMTQLAGGTFFLSGLDYAEFVQGGNSANATVLQLVGNLSGGGTVSQNLALDGFNDGSGGGADFEVASLAAFWSTSELTSLEFFGFDGQGVSRGFQLDNVSVEAGSVPEPATFFLLGGGLAAAGLRRYRRRHA